MRVAVLTGALNEEIPLREWVKDIPEGWDLYVVDDGSTDRTSSVASELGARVIRHSMNLGQGYAFITGVKAIVSEMDLDYDYIVYLDADGQHDPKEIPRFLEKARTEDLDVVIGSRILGSNYANAPFFRRKFLPFYTAIINMLTGYDMTDAMCGFRAFRVSALRKVLPVFDRMIEPQYMAAEMFIRFSRVGLKVGEVPINMRDRISGLSYKGFVRYGFGVLRAIGKTVLDRSER